MDARLTKVKAELRVNETLGSANKVLDLIRKAVDAGEISIEEAIASLALADMRIRFPFGHLPDALESPEVYQGYIQHLSDAGSSWIEAKLKTRGVH